MAANPPDPALTTALTQISGILAIMQANQAAPAAGATPTVLKLFDDGTPFDMASRNGAAGMTLASSALPSKWDGSVLK